ncbi:hypothetical protein [Haladaptatus cibarius]|uniref:hypothetical protein n=1 Tax=Haladaptatus cibarius TaxID=453847 RepID=UPI0006788F74|nr:hypothetical protein [Haladaptatus cibarius]
MDWASTLSAISEKDLSRRQVLSAFGGGGVVLGGAKAADNVLIGYGVLVGTNLHDQDLSAVAGERLEPSPFETTVSGHEIQLKENKIRVQDGDSWQEIPLSASAAADADQLDIEFELAGQPLRQLVSDLSAIEADEYRFEFLGYEDFFRRVRGTETRPFTVEALRGDRYQHVEPSVIVSFSGASPEQPKAVLEGLVDGFRDETYYDIPRYLAGSVEDNILFGSVDLRKHFRTPTEYDAMKAGETAGMFCYEFTWRSVEALHSVPAHQQDVPIAGTKVFDERHKHVYTGVASAFEEAGELVIPMTFVDYTHSTLYDDLRLRWLLGEGMEGYDKRHRATDIYWQP